MPCSTPCRAGCKSARTTDAPSGDLTQAVLEALPSHVAVLDHEGTVVGISGAWRRFWECNGGGPTACGIGSNYLHVCDAAAPDCEDARAVAHGLRAVISGGQTDFFHAYECDSPQQRRWYQLRISRLAWTGPARVLVVHESISEASINAEFKQRRIMEAAQTSRLCLVGRTAVELVHEITQPLAAMRNYAGGSLRRLSDGTSPAELKEALSVILAEAERAESIVRSVRNFAGKRAAERSVFDLRALASHTAALWKSHLRSLGSRLALLPAPDASPVLIEADRVQIEQIIVNALCNAADAAASNVPAREGLIELRISTQGARAVLEVTDSGPGIPPGTNSHLFEPFHTTKPSGLGMGLCICRAIARDHDGDVELTNRPISPAHPAGGGALFRLSLPLASQEMRHAA